MRLLALLALTLLAACSVKEEAVVAEPEVILEAAPAGLGDARCATGDDDGIGGTGCKVD